MDGFRTLREVCETLRISRRAIQGYEKYGLVKASGTNKYGHLLYDERTVNRIAAIRFFQKCGMTVREIRDLNETDPGHVRERLRKLEKELKTKRKELDCLIRRTGTIAGLPEYPVEDLLAAVYEVIQKEDTR